MKVVYDFQHPAGCRIVKIEILCSHCKVPKYEPVLANETYRIVTTSFIANGGDGFKFDRDVLESKETEGKK